MTLVRARAILVGIFVGGLVLELLSVMTAYSKSVISSADVTNLLVKVLEIYSVQFAVILGGIFARPSSPSNDSPREMAAPTPFWVAVSLAMLWNCLMAWRAVEFAVESFIPSAEDNVNYFVSYIDEMSRASSFLVAGALAYFFAKS